MDNKTKKLCLCALLTALTCVATMIIQIPIPATGGYINVGDSMVLISGIFFGPSFGFICGGIGSALADLLSGYAAYAVFTLIVKGIEGFLAAKLAGSIARDMRFFTPRRIAAPIISVIWMICGYFVSDAIVNGAIAPAIASVSGNSIQAVGSAVIFFAVGFALHKANIYAFAR